MHSHGVDTERLRSTVAQVQNTLIEAEGLSANAKARAKALRLEMFEEEGKFVIILSFFPLFSKLTCC
jgi:hypothetical protein